MSDSQGPRELAQQLLAGEYQRPAELATLAVPFGADPYLTRCKASDAVLAEALAGRSELEVEASAAAQQVALRHGWHWLCLIEDPAMVADVVRQHHQSGDRERARARLDLRPGATGKEMERYSRLRRRILW